MGEVKDETEDSRAQRLQGIEDRKAAEAAKLAEKGETIVLPGAEPILTEEALEAFAEQEGLGDEVEIDEEKIVRPEDVVALSEKAVTVVPGAKPFEELNSSERADRYIDFLNILGTQGIKKVEKSLAKPEEHGIEKEDVERIREAIVKKMDQLDPTKRADNFIKYLATASEEAIKSIESRPLAFKGEEADRVNAAILKQKEELGMGESIPEGVLDEQAETEEVTKAEPSMVESLAEEFDVTPEQIIKIVRDINVENEAAGKSKVSVDELQEMVKKKLEEMEIKKKEPVAEEEAVAEAAVEPTTEPVVEPTEEEQHSMQEFIEDSVEAAAKISNFDITPKQITEITNEIISENETAAEPKLSIKDVEETVGKRLGEMGVKKKEVTPTLTLNETVQNAITNKEIIPTISKEGIKHINDFAEFSVKLDEKENGDAWIADGTKSVEDLEGFTTGDWKGQLVEAIIQRDLGPEVTVAPEQIQGIVEAEDPLAEKEKVIGEIKGGDEMPAEEISIETTSEAVVEEEITKKPTEEKQAEPTKLELSANNIIKLIQLATKKDTVLAIELKANKVLAILEEKGKSPKVISSLKDAIKAQKRIVGIQEETTPAETKKALKDIGEDIDELIGNGEPTAEVNEPVAEAKEPISPFDVNMNVMTLLSDLKIPVTQSVALKERMRSREQTFYSEAEIKKAIEEELAEMNEPASKSKKK